MYEAYIEARDSPLRDVKDYCIGKNLVCEVFSFLNECCMVLPYLKGFILINI